MKIFYITAYFPYGKGESFFIPELQYLSRACHVVVVPRQAKGEARSDWPLSSVNVSVLPEGLVTLLMVSELIKCLVKRPKVIVRLSRTIISGGIAHALRNLSMLPKAAWLAKQISLREASHVHAHWGATTATMSMIAAELADVPWSFTCHRWDIYDNNLLAIKSRSARFVRFISSRGLSDALMMGVDPSKAVMIPMGVIRTVDIANRRDARDTFEILCAANLVEVKGHKYLLAAMALLAQLHPNVRLRIAGDGPLLQTLKHQVDDLGIGRVVEFLGQVEQGKLLKLYESGGIDLVALASIELVGGLHEGIPVSLMEAMSFGIPVVSTRTGSIEDLLPRELGLTVPDKDPEALAEVISQLISHRELYAARSDAVKKIIADSWLVEKSVDELVRRMRADFVVTEAVTKITGAGN